MEEAKRRSTEGLVKAQDFWDFIEVRLYDHPDRYILKDMVYYIWSEKNQEFQEHRTTEALTYDYLKRFIEKGLVWLQKK